MLLSFVHANQGHGSSFGICGLTYDLLCNVEGDEAGADVFDAATGRPLSMDVLSDASLQPGSVHASFRGFPDQTGLPRLS